jgi:hypothetical protein
MIPELRAQEIRAQDPWYLKFHDLMPFRVREILLVSSPYDAFTLEADGRLTERIFTEYSELNLGSAPRVTHVSTGARAMEVLAERRFDLVVTMPRIADTDVSAFGRRVKSVYPTMPVVLLVLTEADLKSFPGGVDPKVIDRVFWWTGDARILLAVIKLVEDAQNAPADTAKAGVRVIVVVEDSVRRYSSFLSLLYGELMAQSGSLVAEGVNDLHRLMRMRARPKLLLARSYEEAMGLFRRYQEYVVALVSDVEFPRGGELDPSAGFDLVRLVRAEEPELAVLLQSADSKNEARAAALGVHYADKNSTNLLGQIRLFVTESLGFGDFVFRLPDRTEVGRARDVYELERELRTLPAASLEYHATRNHFSLWLMARCMFALANEVRPRKTQEFGDLEGLRLYLLRTLAAWRQRQQEGVITDFSARGAEAGSPFLRMGKGSIGGKARGLAFVSSILARHDLARRYEGMAVRVPRSLVIPTDEFDRFLETNRILEGGLKNVDGRTVLARCLAGRHSESFAADLRRAVAALRGPVAVRSSSLLEDSQLQPFAGIYATVMLPNNHPDPQVRFEELCTAIRAVYASTYSEDARAYIARTPYSIEEEKMAVLIQEIVGGTHGQRFYPHLSGVAVSYNHYPIGAQRPEDGLAMIALGLGHTIVQGGAALQFSPATPSLLPQFGSAKDYLQFSQRRFCALDLSHRRIDLASGADSALMQLDVADAEADGTLALAASVYSPDDDLLRDNLGAPGPRVVTFHNILKWDALPLAPALCDLLALFREGMGCPVEVEFALEAGAWGNPGADEAAAQPCLAVLQVRPQAVQHLESAVDAEAVPPERVLCQTNRSLGHGVIQDVRDVVVVKRRDLEAHETKAIAAQVGEMNARLTAEGRPYLLVGPGRWGSSDPRLGIPVKWAQIAGARVIVEASFKDREVEPSQGAHFFHNVTSFRIGYLTLHGADRPAAEGERAFDFAWLARQPTAHETAEVRHVRLEKPLTILLDGRKSRATILKP